MIIQLNENFTNINSEHHRIVNKEYISPEFDTIIDLSTFLNSEFYKCSNIKDFKERFNNILLMCYLLICVNHSNNFKNVIKNLIKIYINYDRLVLDDVEYHPLNHLLINKYFISEHSSSNDYRFVDKDGNLYKLNYLSNIKVNNTEYINYGCYIIIFNDTVDNTKKRYLVCYRTPGEYRDAILIPLIKKLKDNEYEELHQAIEGDEYHPEVQTNDIHDFCSKLEFN